MPINPSSPLRIGYICTSLGWGGLEMNHLKNAQWMKDRGHVVFFICSNNSPLAKELKNSEIPFVEIPKPARHYALFAAFKIWRHLKQAQISDVFLRNPSDLSLFASISIFSKQKIRAHFFMEMMFQGNKKQFFRTFRYRRLHSWVCSLNYMKKIVENATKIDPSKIIVIPSGIDFSLIRNDEKTGLRKKLQFNEEAFCIGIIGRIDRKKRIDLVLDALTFVQHQKTQLYIIGEPTPDIRDTYLRELQEKIQLHKLQDRVYFCGFQKNPYPYFRALDAVVMASDFETFGMSSIESIAHGTPVIGTKAGGTEELLKRFPFGMLFEVGSPKSLAKSIDEIQFHKNSAFQVDEFLKTFNHHKICEMIEARILSL